MAERYIARGYSVDIGLMQVNSRNLAALGVTVEQVLDPCRNIHAAATILTADYAAAARTRGDGQAALQAALSAYNTGDFYRGFANGYVARYYGPGGVPALIGGVRMRPQRRSEQAATATPQSLHGQHHCFCRGGNACPHRVTAPRDPPASAIISHALADLLVPGVVVELDAREAEDLGRVRGNRADRSRGLGGQCRPRHERGRRWRLSTSIRSPARSSSN